MSQKRAVPERRSARDRQSAGIRTVARTFGALNLLAGLLGFVGPAIRNDDGLLNTDPGLFLGLIAVNGRHALVHVLYGALGLLAGRNAASARGYMGLGAGLFGTVTSSPP